MSRTPRPEAGRSRRSMTGVALAVFAIAIVIVIAQLSATDGRQNALTFSNESGVLAVLGTDGTTRDNPFFEELGTNGRTCATCHRPAQAWSITPAELRDRFDHTDGLDPIFRSNDGSNCEGADISTIKKRRRAFSLLLTKGLIRVGLDLPAGAEFDILDVDDPYHCGAPLTAASMYRRPLPSANLKFISAVMWDGRASAPGRAIREGLEKQVFDAVTGHAQGAPPAVEQTRDIVDFELELYAAQVQGRSAGRLDAAAASGGPHTMPSFRHWLRRVSLGELSSYS